MPRSGSRGLPGFLRRTIRNDYDVEDHHDSGGTGDISSGNGRKQQGGNNSNRWRGGAGRRGVVEDLGSNSSNNIHNNDGRSSSSSSPTVGESPSLNSKKQPASVVVSSSPMDQRSSSPSLDVSTTATPSSAVRRMDDTNNSKTPDAVVLREESESSASAAASSAAAVDDSGNEEPPKQRQQRQQQQQQSTATATPTAAETAFNSSSNTAADTSFFVPSVIRTGEPERKTYKESQFDKIIGADILNAPDLRRLAWNGIPVCYRSQAWKFMLGYLPTNSTRRADTIRRKRSEYNTAIQQHYDIHDDTRTTQEQETLRQVLVDVPRTAPDVPLFRNERIRKLLSRLLYIWAMRHPASSYVQGINDLATPFIAVFLSDHYNGGQDVLDGNVMLHLSQEKLDQIEADCYWCLTNLLAGIQDHYTSDQPGVQRMVLRLEELVNRIDAALCEHLRNMGIEFMQFAFKWMNCLLLREFNLRCVIRLWDTYISEMNGFEDFHVYVCAAFLCQFSTELQSMDFDNLFAFMQSMPTEKWGDTEIEMLLSQAYVLSTLFGGSDAHLTSLQQNSCRF